MSPLRRSRPEPAGHTLVVGLGNPGKRYETTRHNLGVKVLEVLVGRAGGKLKRHKSGCLVAGANIGGVPALLARPATYVNLSGRPVAELARWYRVSPEGLVVIHDELDIAFGVIRVKKGGGTAGHNGLASLVAHLHTRDFVRVRVGVGRPPGRRDPVDFVLSEFSSAERKELPLVLEEAADAVELVLEVGPERAMNEVNTRSK